VPKGHRIRLALANQHWPILWPQPTLSTLTDGDGSRAGWSCRCVRHRPVDRDTLRFEPAETAAAVPTTVLTEGFEPAHGHR
jgi:hypothetical protein